MLTDIFYERSGCNFFGNGMPITINSNISSLRIQRAMSQNDTAIASTFERLSSGMRITRASDDAAGLAIASLLNADRRVYSQGIRNINDGVSALQIADESLSSLADITMRLKELATSAANGTYSIAQRRSMETEAVALTDEFNRVVATTKFNGINLIDGRLGSLTIQAGYGTTGQLRYGLGTELDRVVGDGTYQSVISIGTLDQPYAISGDFDKNGTIDIAAAFLTTGGIQIFSGNGDGTFKAGVSYVGGAGNIAIQFADINEDGYNDILTGGSSRVHVLLGNSDGTYRAAVSYAANGGDRSGELVDVNGDGNLDWVAVGSSFNVSILIGNGDGSFKNARTFSNSSSTSNILRVADLNNDGYTDLVTADFGGSSINAFLGNGDGTFRAKQSFIVTVPVSTGLDVGDFNFDGYTDVVTFDGAASGNTNIYLGRGDGNFQSAGSYTPVMSSSAGNVYDLNGDGVLDIVTTTVSGEVAVMHGNGDGTFQQARTMAGTGSQQYTIGFGDFNRDGATDVLAASRANDSLGIFLANPTNTTTIQKLNLTTRQGALNALSTIEDGLSRINAERGGIGAHLTRLTSAFNTLSVARDNFAAAESRIMDADIAHETASLVRQQILQQTTASLLAQGNQQPALALRLLQG